jgi:hypothetical protein
MRPSIQNAITLSPSPLPNNSRRPLRQREPPMTRHQYATENIDHLNHKLQETISAFLNCKKHRLNIVFEEYAGYGTLADYMRLLGYSVLVCVDGA